MKTALTELIQELWNEANDPDWTTMERTAYSIAAQMAEKKLKQERQQIEDALLYGHAEATHTSPLIDLSFTDRYFTDKFEQ